MIEKDDVNQLREEIRDSFTQLTSGIGEIRSTLTAFIERLTRLEERSERIPQLEKRVDALGTAVDKRIDDLDKSVDKRVADLDKKMEPIRDDVISATTAAKWANKIATWVMPALFTALAAIAGLYIKDHVSQQIEPIINEMHSIQRDQQADINDIRSQLRAQQQKGNVEIRNARY